MSATPTSGERRATHAPTDAPTDAPTGSPARSRRRSRSLGVVLAVCVAVLLSAVPGLASAATTSSVAPLVDCYRQNSDGSYTIIFGYSNSGSRTTAIPYGPENVMSPAAINRSQPTAFRGGTQRGAFSVDVDGWQLLSVRWNLDGRTVNFWTVVFSPQCSPSTPLPAIGNGTGLAIALVAGGAFGVVFVRRLIRRAVPSS